MTVWYEHHAYGYTTVLVDAFNVCFWCGGTTNTLDVDFEGYLHQGLCALEALNAYWDAQRPLPSQQPKDQPMNLIVHEPPINPGEPGWVDSVPSGTPITDYCGSSAELAEIEFPFPVAWYCTRPIGHEPPHAAHGGPHGPQYASWDDE